MDFNQFAECNRRRCEAPNGYNTPLRSKTFSEWFKAMVGELGEAANISTKLDRIKAGTLAGIEPGVTEETLRVALAKELADVYGYLDLLVQSEGLNMEGIIAEKFAAKSEQIGYKPSCRWCGLAVRPLETVCPLCVHKGKN
jgi:NTP pyrophosphatase (non-canonical NTP hydrolase)